MVYERALAQIGTATTGSQGTVVYEDFAIRPLSRVGELVENVPGLIATQHSGTGKANQYFLRGFSLDHGTDLAGYVDGACPTSRRTASTTTISTRSSHASFACRSAAASDEDHRAIDPTCRSPARYRLRSASGALRTTAWRFRWSG